MLLCVFLGHTQYIFHISMAYLARYSVCVLKVPINTKQTNLTDFHKIRWKDDTLATEETFWW